MTFSSGWDSRFHGFVSASMMKTSEISRSLLVETSKKGSSSLEKVHAKSQWNPSFLVIFPDGFLTSFDYSDSISIQFQINLTKCRGLLNGPFSLQLIDLENDFSVSLKDKSGSRIEFLQTAINESLFVGRACEDLIVRDGDEKYSINECFRPSKSSKFISVLKCKEIILKGIAGDDFASIDAFFAPDDIRDICPENFDDYLQLALNSLLKSGSFATCPKCKLHFEVDSHTSETSTSHLTSEPGLDKRPMSIEAQKHYLSNRIRCRNCDETFCRSCSVSPYHTGFDCKEYQAYLTAPHCRYCTTIVIKGRNSLTSDSFEDVCDSKLCAEKASRSCLKRNPCGHSCFGFRDEKSCPPCLLPACIIERKDFSQLQTISDMCCICYSEDLGSAPVLKLTSCGHLFHYHCLVSRISRKWIGARISFKFLNCPLCLKPIHHEALESLLEPARELQAVIDSKIRERIVIEALEQEDKVQDPESEYFGDVLKYAWATCVFYQCFRCSNPYFGGRRACEVNLVEEADPSLFVCPECALEHGKGKVCSNPEHAEFVVWKCRYCCEPASWFW
jgi:hypothetical protein